MDTEQTQADSVESRLTSFFAQPEEAAAEPVAEAPEELSTAETPEPEQAEQEPASETFEVDGVEYQLPAELKAKVAEWRDGYTRRDDYTKKTQETAELLRQAQAMREAHEHSVQFETQVKAERRELDQLESTLEQFSKLDWRQLDTEQRLNLLTEQSMLERKANALRQTLDNKRQAFDREQMERQAKVFASGQKYLQQTIPGWGEKAIQDIVKTAKEIGFSDQELSAITDARQIRLAWMAAQYQRIVANKGNAVAAAQKAPPVVKPGASKPGALTEQKVRDATGRFKKSGDLRDGARLLIAKGLV